MVGPYHAKLIHHGNPMHLEDLFLGGRSDGDQTPKRPDEYQPPKKEPQGK